jgi:unsaturated rhamnogalacturonyl hydrolase
LDLMYHGWDESKQMAWADKNTGLSPEVWARAMGWYAMALVDVLDWVPETRIQHALLVGTLQRVMTGIVQYQDPANGLWWQVLDKGPMRMVIQPQGGQDFVLAKAMAGNFPEASASCMFVYALAKGVRKGYLSDNYGAKSILLDKWEIYAQRGWEGIQKQFVTTDANGLMALNGTVKVGGLGGTPYRSGSYEYYVGEKTQANDAKGAGAFLLAGSEMEQARTELIVRRPK